MFHMGWFNHQLETSISTVKSPNKMVGYGGGHPPKDKMFDIKHVDERFMGFLDGFLLKIMPPWKKMWANLTKHLSLFKGEGNQKKHQAKPVGFFGGWDVIKRFSQRIKMSNGGSLKQPKSGFFM